MIHCPHCGATNQDGTKFCSCGQPLPALTADGLPCPQCGAENEPGAMFCGECGARLMPASPAAPEEPTPRGPVKGFSLPKRQTGELDPAPSSDVLADVPEEVPPWLQKLFITHGLSKPEEEGVEREEEMAVRPEPGEQPSPVELKEEGEAPSTDWLQDLRSTTEDWEQELAEVRETLPPPDEEVTDWLQGLREPDTEAVAEPSDIAGVDEEELPDWLRDLSELGVEAEPALPTEKVPPPVEMPETEEEDLSDWLVGLREEEFAEETIVSPQAAPSPVVPAVEEPEPEGEEVPEWLREVRKPEVAEEKDASPDWLSGPDIVEGKESELSEPPALVVPEAPAEKAEDGEDEEKVEIPEWLQELRGVELTPAEEMPGEVVAPPEWLAQPAAPDVIIEEGKVRMPDWLQGPEPLDSEAEDEEREVRPPDWLSELGPPVSPLTKTEDEPAAAVPSWLEELEPATEAPDLEEVPPFIGVEVKELTDLLEQPLPEVPLTEADGLAAADIPDWLLALRPREAGEEPAEVQEILELSGPLAGIRSVLPVEPIISLPHLTRPESAAVEISPVSGDLFAEIVAQPSVSAAAKPKRAGARLVVGVQRVLIYLLLLAAVVVPILVGPIYGRLNAAELQAGVEPFYAVLDGRGRVALADDALVVVAFDYNPASAAELSLQARAIVDHLMRRGVRIMAISLFPEGAALAWDVLDELATERGYTYGENYIHLGYLPNQPVSVRHFLNVGPTGEGQSDYRSGRPVGQYAIAQDVDSLSSVDLVVELAGNESTLRTWIEQITARTDVPVVAGVSAATAPYVRPYLDSGQLQALLVGLPGAAEYEAQAGRSGRAIDSLGSQAAAQAVIVLLILLGNLVHLVTRGGKK